MRVSVLLGWLIMLSAAFVAFGRLGEIQTCQQNDDCTEGKCCVEEECTAFLSVGQRCNVFTQILSLQCPCEIGSSCSTRKCHSIEQEYFGKEVVEDRDAQHIAANSVDE